MIKVHLLEGNCKCRTDPSFLKTGLLDGNFHSCSHRPITSSEDYESFLFPKEYFTFSKVSVNVSPKDLLFLSFCILLFYST